MSTQRIHFLTVIGRAAAEVEAACESLLARRVEDHPRGVGGTDYGPAEHVRIERLCLALLDAADELPVLHHGTYLDGWAMGNLVLRALTWPDGRERALLGLNYGVAIYPSRHAPALLDEVAKARRRARPPAGAWYENGLAQAFAAGGVFKVDYVVIAVAECLGASRLDDDVHSSAKAPLPGVSRGHPRRPRHADPARVDQLGAWLVVPIPTPADATNAAKRNGRKKRQ